MKKLSLKQEEEVKAIRKIWMPKVGGTSLHDELQIKENASFRPFSYGINFYHNR